MAYDDPDPRRLLQQLRDDSLTVISEKGLFSSEFQAWHAAAVRVLRDHFGSDDSLYRDFTTLQFEWAPEILSWFREAHIASLENPTPEMLKRIAELSSSGEAASQETARSMARALEAMESQDYTHAQRKKFRSAMEHASEILGAALHFFDRHTKRSSD